MCSGQNCRFHISYQQEVINCGEREFAFVVEDEGIELKTPSGSKLPDFSIESGKAFDIFWNHRRRTFCDPCEPLILGLDEEEHICRCGLFDHFVGHRWLCLPCFFLEEASAYRIRERKFIIAYELGSSMTSNRVAYIEVCSLIRSEHVLDADLHRLMFVTAVSWRDQNRSRFAGFAMAC